MEGRGSSDTIESMDVGIAESLINSTASTGTTAVESMDLHSVGSDNGGSARTDALGNFIQSQRAKKRQQLTLAKKMAELGTHTSELNAGDHYYVFIIIHQCIYTFYAQACHNGNYFCLFIIQIQLVTFISL